VFVAAVPRAGVFGVPLARVAGVRLFLRAVCGWGGGGGGGLGFVG